MVWTGYVYKAGPLGGTLLTLTDYCSSVRIIDEGGPDIRGGDVTVQYLHGEHAVPHKFAAAGLIELEVVLRYTSAAGTITHADGAEGHVFENLSEVKRLLRGQGGLATLERVAPDQGTVQIDVGYRKPTPTQNRFTYLFPLVVARPFWRSTTVQTDSSSPIAVGGDAPVDDAEIDFSAAASSPVFTHTSSPETVKPTITYTGTVPAGGVRVFTLTGQAINITGGADCSNLVSFNKPYYLELNAGVSNTYTISSGTVTVRWQDKWG